MAQSKFFAWAMTMAIAASITCTGGIPSDQTASDGRSIVAQVTDNTAGTTTQTTISNPSGKDDKSVS